MKREVIQDFLNLPGIAGVALMDGRSRPYFCGIDQTLNFQQKEALAQGILQVVETIPDGFNLFEFQFTEYQVRLYRLDRGMVLLVLTCSELVTADYLVMIKRLQNVLQEDIPNAIATFRLMAGNITLTGLHYHKHSVAPPPAEEPDAYTPPEPVETTPSQTIPTPSETPSKAVTAKTETLKDAIAALNHLSQFTTQYLGTHVIANYWKATRPQSDLVANLQIDRAAQFSFTGTSPQDLAASLTAQEREWLQLWVAAFIKRCTQVIRDFPTLVKQTALDEHQAALLLASSEE
ncbi:MAG: hypothetical protein ACAF41_29365 [Leptolyngbya sp. BL-A-14]